jgi:hypothetical protein
MLSLEVVITLPANNKIVPARRHFSCGDFQIVEEKLKKDPIGKLERKT